MKCFTNFAFDTSHLRFHRIFRPVSGYGGYPATIDPRGFNAQTQNFTHGVFIDQVNNGPPKTGFVKLFEQAMQCES